MADKRWKTSLIGLRSPTEKCKDFEWLNGHPLEYANWFETQHCNDNTNYQWCAEIDMGGSGNGTWRYAYCDSERLFICQAEPIESD